MNSRLSSENYSVESEDENNPVMNNTEPSDNTMEVYSQKENIKPKPENKTWCSYMERGFRESRLKSTESSEP